MMDFCLTPLGRQMVEDNMRLAAMVVNQYPLGPHVSRDDRDQMAYLGLIKAVVSFDERKGFTFGTYAGRSIAFWLLRHAQDDRLIHVPIHCQDASRVKKYPHLAAEAERAMSVTLFSALEHLGTIDGPVDVEAPESDDDIDADGLDRHGRREARVAALTEALASLPGSHRSVIRQRMGGKSHRTIAAKNHCDVERIRRIEAEAIEMIRRRMEGEPPTAAMEIGAASAAEESRSGSLLKRAI